VYISICVASSTRIANERRCRACCYSSSMRYCINTSNVNIINIGMNTIIFILMINIIILINMIHYSESDSCVNVFEFQFCSVHSRFHVF